MKEVSKIKILKDNEVYRVSDLIGQKKTNKAVVELLTNDKYRDTILYRYFQRTDSSNNYEVLKKIILECNYKKADEDDIVVHLRAGDAHQIYGLGNKLNYDFILKEIDKYDSSMRVNIVTAFHYGHSLKENSIYRGKANAYSEESYKTNIHLIENFIDNIPNKVNIISNDDIDKDLFYLTTARNLIVGPFAGGFAKTVKILNTLYNETI